MSGEDDRGQAKPTKPIFDEAEFIPHRARRVKPPPGIISAGGVDMARAHASGIKLRDVAMPEPIVDQPRVVVAVETDPRKVPTHKRLLAGRAPSADGARAAMLPEVALATPASGSLIPRGRRSPAPRGEPTPQAKEHKLPLSLRIAFALGLLLALMGVAERYREPLADGGLSVKTPAEPRVIAPPVHEAARGVLVEAPRTAPQPVSNEAPASSSAAPASSSAAPASSAEALRRPVRAPPPRAAFTPPFQLPGEKN
jgi:hypothetical protein